MKYKPKPFSSLWSLSYQYPLHILFSISSIFLMFILTENLGNMVPDVYYSMYNFSHPPLVERLRALKLTDGALSTIKMDKKDTKKTK